MLNDIIKFIKKNVVLVIAIVAASVTSIIVPPDSEYLSYFDLKTLTCLFCVLAVVCAFKNINFFYTLALKIVKTFKNLRMSILVLVYITFIGSMLIANDMALLTFLPLGYYVLTTAKKQKYMAFTFILQYTFSQYNIFLYCEFYSSGFCCTILSPEAIRELSKAKQALLSTHPTTI